MTGSALSNMPASTSTVAPVRHDAPEPDVTDGDRLAKRRDAHRRRYACKAARFQSQRAACRSDVSVPLNRAAPGFSVTPGTAAQVRFRMFICRADAGWSFGTATGRGGGGGLAWVGWAGVGRVGVSRRRASRWRSRRSGRGLGRRRCGRPLLRLGGGGHTRVEGAGGLAAARASGGTERLPRARAAHEPAAANARARRTARQDDQHRAGEQGSDGGSPGRHAPWVAGQHGWPPAAAPGLMTARATHAPHTAGWLEASPPGACSRPSACPHAIKAEPPL